MYKITVSRDIQFSFIAVFAFLAVCLLQLKLRIRFKIFYTALTIIIGQFNDKVVLSSIGIP